MKETIEQETFEQLLTPYHHGTFFRSDTESATWLYATFKINLPEAVLVEGEPGEAISIGVNLDGDDVDVQLSLNPQLGRVKKGRDGGWCYLVNEVDVTVLRCVDLPNGAESKDDYFKHALLPQYQQAAIAATNRLVTFLKYRLWRSFFSAIGHFADAYDGNANALVDISTSPRFQIQAMADEQIDVLQKYIDENYSHELAGLFLAQAQQSIQNKRARRACLELTMACESFVKQRISVVNQLAGAIDDGFKSRHQAAYIDLNGLFQARDEAAKKGEGFFCLSSQAKRDERQENLMMWGASVTCLKQWLYQKS